jgi:hypothetical protein
MSGNSAAKTIDSPTWVTARRIQRELGINSYALWKAATMGTVRTLIEPGSTIRYSFEDAQRLQAKK